VKNFGILIILTFLINACSLSNTSKEAVSQRPADEADFVVDTFGSPSPEGIKVEEQPVVENKIPDEMAIKELPIQVQASETSSNVQDVAKTNEENIQPGPSAEVLPEDKKIVMNEEKPAESIPEIPAMKNEPVAKSQEVVPEITKNENYDSPVKQTGSLERYIVQKNETLMTVAFKIYGDYRKWRDLKKWNEGTTNTKISQGTSLKYYVPVEKIGWQPNGLPYMVKTKDTLQLISMDKYGTTKKWKKIYDNNRPLIRNPNLIFAGFTIYYVPFRNVASENK
jgi:hypothetical protein